LAAAFFFGSVSAANASAAPEMTTTSAADAISLLRMNPPCVVGVVSWRPSYFFFGSAAGVAAGACRNRGSSVRIPHVAHHAPLAVLLLPDLEEFARVDGLAALVLRDVGPRVPCHVAGNADLVRSHGQA
jgi:hypothetical protein